MPCIAGCNFLNICLCEVRCSIDSAKGVLGVVLVHPALGAAAWGNIVATAGRFTPSAIGPNT